MSSSPAAPFEDLTAYVALPRLGGLALSPDGTRLAVGVQTLDAERKKWRTALWEVDPAGSRGPRRLTRSAPGESRPAWAPDGSLLFTSSRPDPSSTDDDDEPRAALWSLPAGGGEARPVVSRPGGVASFLVAADSGHVVLVSDTLPGGADAEEDQRRRKERTDAGVTAVLHDRYPVRYWDQDLGPATPHHFSAGSLPGEGPAGTTPEPVELRDLTPDAAPPAGAGDAWALSPDGTLLARSVHVPDGPAGRRTRLVLTATADGSHRVLVDDPLADLQDAAFSPDGSLLVCVREALSTYAEPTDYTLLLVDVAAGSASDLTPGFTL